jgi:hypothetical protein
MNIQIKKNDICLYATYLLIFSILLLPLHTQAFYMVLPKYTHISKELISTWKEAFFIIIALIFLFNALLCHKPIHIILLDVIVISFILYLLLYLLVSDDIIESFYGFRVFVEPFLVFYLARSAIMSTKLVNKLFTAMFYSGVIIGFWGIIQAAILGDSFLIDLGYNSVHGRLSPTYYIAMFLFQRAVGTFASPNTFGIYLQMSIMLGIYLYHIRVISNKFIYYMSNFIMVCALLYSFSRSSILALIFSLAIFTISACGFKKFISRSIKIIVFAAVILIIAYCVNKNIVEPIFTHSINTITLQDTSTVGHLDSLKDSLEFILKNPLGIGLGKSGPRASARTGIDINSENSFFIVLFDMGCFGLIYYLLIMVTIAYKLYVNIEYSLNVESRTLHLIILAIFAGQIVAWNLLPYIVELETTLILYFLLGIGVKDSVTKEYSQVGVPLLLGTRKS